MSKIFVLLCDQVWPAQIYLVTSYKIDKDVLEMTCHNFVQLENNFISVTRYDQLSFGKNLLQNYV